FVECAAIGKADRLRPHGLVGVRVFTSGVPIAIAAIEVAEALVEEEPELAAGIGPEIADQRPALRGIWRIGGVDDDTRLRPGSAVVVARGQHEEAVRVIAIAHPAGPE